jgi:hypothetical protein
MSAGVFEAVAPPSTLVRPRAFPSFQLGAYPAATGVSALRTSMRRLQFLFAITALILLIVRQSRQPAPRPRKLAIVR